MKKKLLLLGALLIASMILVNGQATGAAMTAASVVCNILKNVKTFFMLIASGVAVVIIIINGIKWIGSSDDPGARKQAKEGIIHAIVGLIIVIVAVYIVGLVMEENACQGTGVTMT